MLKTSSNTKTNSFARRSYSLTEEKKNNILRESEHAAADINPSCQNTVSELSYKPKNFPHKLYEMLDYVEKNNHQDIVSWQPHGRCFRVHNTKQFADKIIKIFFRQSKWASFQRQLHLYGFTRFGNGLDKGGYYHRYFIRGQPSLCDRIVRTKVKGTKFRIPYSSDNEPNFYTTDYVTTTNDVDGDVIVCGDMPLQQPHTVMSSTSVANNLTDAHLQLDEWANEPLSLYNDESLDELIDNAEEIQERVAMDKNDKPSSTATTMTTTTTTTTTTVSRKRISIQEAESLFLMDQQKQKTMFGKDEKKLLLEKNKEKKKDKYIPSFLSNKFFKMSDDPKHLKDVFSSFGKPLCFDELDSLPTDDNSWEMLLESIQDISHIGSMRNNKKKNNNNKRVQVCREPFARSA